MSIERTIEGKWRAIARVKISGKVIERRGTTTSKSAAKLLEETLKQEMRQGSQCSLTVSAIKTFSDAINYYRDHTEADLKKVDCLFNKLIKDIGNTKITELAIRFSTYWRFLRDDTSFWTGEKLKSSTKNKLLGYSNIALNFCFKRGLIDRNPLLQFNKLPEAPRDRILDENEKERIVDVMRNFGQIYPSYQFKESYLLPAFLFSLKNPIRKGDLESLTRDNLDCFKPWVHFYASKTRKVKPRETCLPFLDEYLMNHFKSLPVNCPYLFPRMGANGQFHQLGDFKNHWQGILDASKVKDFHWHDLKHCAITWIIDGGYSERDLMNLGIQYSQSMINRYYKNDANKVLNKWKAGKESASGECLVKVI